MLLGLVAMVGLAGRGISDDVRRNLGFIVRMEHDVAPEHINTVKKVLAHAPYTAQYVYSSASDIMVQESAALGEDISQLLEVNPYSGEFDVKNEATLCQLRLDHIRGGAGGDASRCR